MLIIELFTSCILLHPNIFKQKPCIMLGLKNLLWTWLPGYQDTFMFFLIDLVIKYIMITLKCNEYIYLITRLSASETVDLDSFVCFCFLHLKFHHSGIWLTTEVFQIQHVWQLRDGSNLQGIGRIWKVPLICVASVPCPWIKSLEFLDGEFFFGGGG